LDKKKRRHGGRSYKMVKRKKLDPKKPMEAVRGGRGREWQCKTEGRLKKLEAWMPTVPKEQTDTKA
jgi:hypothetical protein